MNKTLSSESSPSKPSDHFTNVQFPVIAAPMFLSSGPELVIACCANGMIGSFPALNQRTSAGFSDWLDLIRNELEIRGCSQKTYGVNLIVHRSNPRVGADLEICVEHEVPLVITSLGANAEVVEAVNGYGGLVFHDVTNLRHARSAMRAGVDGLVLVANGAGGHGGTANPFALLTEIRSEFDGYIALAGALSNGAHVAAARAAGADFAYIGTRFIATTECYSSEDYKNMLIEAALDDIVYTASFSGVPGNYLRQSIELAGLDPANLPEKKIDFGKDLDSEKHAWKDIWSAGHGVSDIHEVLTVEQLSKKMMSEYEEAVKRVIL